MEKKEFNLKNKYKIFGNKHLSTMTIEIDITKSEQSFKQILLLIQKLEEKELLKNDLEIKDIYFK